ncbi:MAG: hypothetical protein NVS3B10_23260 [Polyangiales bacterium]
MAQVRGNWFPSVRAALDRHALLVEVDAALPVTTHNILWNTDAQAWFDEGHAVAIYEAIARARNLEVCREVGRDAARFAMVSTWRDLVQAMVGLMGNTPRMAFEHLPILWNASRHALTEVQGFPYANSQAWAQVWLGHHEAVLRQLRFAGRAALEPTAEGGDPSTIRVRVSWGGALGGHATGSFEGA